MLKIVTDSSADLPPEIVRELDITVVPLSIHFGDTTYIDGEDIDASQFYRLLQTSHAHPRTAHPSVGRFTEAYRTLAAARHEILTITIASSFSGTYNSASLAARDVPEARVTVIDSETVSMAAGSIAIRAAEMGREGCPTEEVVATVQEMIPRLSVAVVVDTLTYLQRGGRIGRASSLVGTMLNIKPILTIRDGQVTPVKRVRTRAKGVQEIVDLVTVQAPLDGLYVLHTAAPQEAADLAARLSPLYGDREVPVLPLGPVVGVHVGPGAVGAITLRSG
jgi:DegV family protein with EDD domain